MVLQFDFSRLVAVYILDFLLFPEIQKVFRVSTYILIYGLYAISTEQLYYEKEDCVQGIGPGGSEINICMLASFEVTFRHGFMQCVTI